MRYAAELVALAPDVILALCGMVVGALLETTRTTPIVFVAAVDPVGAGLVASLARPGGNATGFTAYEYGLAAKWLELLKDIAAARHARCNRSGPDHAGGVALFGAIRGGSSSLRVELVPIDMRDADELERGVTAFAQTRMVDLIVMASAFAEILPT